LFSSSWIKFPPKNCQIHSSLLSRHPMSNIHCFDSFSNQFCLRTILFKDSRVVPKFSLWQCSNIFQFVAWKASKWENSVYVTRHCPKTEQACPSHSELRVTTALSKNPRLWIESLTNW
jgi:hypothetical protein